MGHRETLVKRILSSTFILSLLGFINFQAPLIVYTSMTAFIIFLALREYSDMATIKGVAGAKWPMFVIGLLYPYAICFTEARYGSLLSVYFIGLFYLLFISLAFSKKPQNALLSVASSLFGFMYVSWCLSFFVNIRLLPQGAKLVCFIILVCKFGDAGAYFVGTKYGKHQLMKQISPKKSVEGAIGGLVFSVLGALLSALYIDNVSFLQLLFLGFSIGVLAQSGDLVESLLKRDCGIKDSGSLFPGLGGVLDIVDSIVFVVPIFYLYCYKFL